MQSNELVNTIKNKVAHPFKGLTLYPAKLEKIDEGFWNFQQLNEKMFDQYLHANEQKNEATQNLCITVYFRAGFLPE